MFGSIHIKTDWIQDGVYRELLQKALEDINQYPEKYTRKGINNTLMYKEDYKWFTCTVETVNDTEEYVIMKVLMVVETPSTEVSDDICIRYDKRTGDIEEVQV